jgi:hypothetical protein
VHGLARGRRRYTPFNDVRLSCALLAQHSCQRTHPCTRCNVGKPKEMKRRCGGRRRPAGPQDIASDAQRGRQAAPPAFPRRPRPRNVAPSST